MTSHTSAYDALIDSWELALDAENKSPRTIGTYLKGLRLLVRWLDDQDGPRDPGLVTSAWCRQWLAEPPTRACSGCRGRTGGG